MYFLLLRSRVKLYQLTDFMVYLLLLLIVFNVLFLFSRPVDVCARCWFSRRRTFEGELCPSNIDFRGGVMPLKHWLYGRELSLTKHHQAHERELCRLIAHGREICLTNHCLTGGGQASQTSIYILFLTIHWLTSGICALQTSVSICIISYLIPAENNYYGDTC